ncbi:hypothetical protein B566_EDAN015983, partial [Ephemera danica]
MNTFQNALSPEIMTDPREESMVTPGLSSSDPQHDDDCAIKLMDVDEEMPVLKTWQTFPELLSTMNFDGKVPDQQAAEQEEECIAATTSKPSLAHDEATISESTISPTEDACVHLEEMSCTNYGNTINAASDTSEPCDKNLNTCQNAFGPELMTDPKGESIGKQGLSSSDPQLDIDLAIKRMDVDEDMPELLNTMNVDEEVPDPQAAEKGEECNAASSSKPN